MKRPKYTPRSERNKRCEKPGMCLGIEGEPILRCNDAPGYQDYALPLSENACMKTIAEHEPYMNDPYKEAYVRISHQLDQTLSDPYLASSPGNLDVRFNAIERDLRELIQSPELSAGDNGRYLYHIDARMLEAYLGAFYHRTLHGIEAPMPREIIENTHQAMAEILADFDGLYRNTAAPVAFKRTEIEIPIFLLRTKDPNWFTYPTLFREDASHTREYNHDSYNIHLGGKTPIQIKHTDYRRKNGKRASQGYVEGTLVAIHQDVVNLDFRDGETHVTVVEPKERYMDEDDAYPYSAYDEEPRFIAWGARHDVVVEEEYPTEYIQKIGGYRRDGLVDALVREAHGEKLSIDELNMLNGASHYLMAAIREKR